MSGAHCVAQFAVAAVVYRCCAWARVERAALSGHPVGAGGRAAAPTGIEACESDPFLYQRGVAAQVRQNQWQVVSSAVVGKADPAGEKPSATEPGLLAWFSRMFPRPETLASPCFSSYPPSPTPGWFLKIAGRKLRDLSLHSHLLFSSQCFEKIMTNDSGFSFKVAM